MPGASGPTTGSWRGVSRASFVWSDPPVSGITLTVSRRPTAAPPGQLPTLLARPARASQMTTRSTSAVSELRLHGRSEWAPWSGRKITRLARRSAEKRIPLILVSTSGGARCSEWSFSLMQMAKTSAAIAQLYQLSIPYVSILTNPTTGGVSASSRDAGRRHFWRSLRRGDRVRRSAGHQADHRAGPPRGIPDRRVPAGEGADRRRHPAGVAPGDHGPPASTHAGQRPHEEPAE